MDSHVTFVYHQQDAMATIKITSQSIRILHFRFTWKNGFLKARMVHYIYYFSKCSNKSSIEG